MEKVVVIISGGMDSTTLLYDVVNRFGKENVYALSFNYNQKHKRELKMATKTCQYLKVQHKILDLKILNQIAPSSLTRDDWKVPEGHYEHESMKQTVVPNRNMVMLSLAVSYALGINATKVFYGAHSGDHAIYPDCRPEFINAMKNVILLCDDKQIELLAPYIILDKGDICIKGKELKVKFKYTHTCYSPIDNKACGKCGACQERLEAFKKANIKDPIKYVEEIK